MQHLLLCFIVFCFLNACGRDPQSSSQPLVIGGTPSPAPRYFAALHSPGAIQPFCGASLIAPHLLVTAAHCVNRPDAQIEVWLAPENLSALPLSRRVEAVVVHPRYHASRFQHDVALLFLEPSPKSKGPGIALATAERAAGSLRIYGYGNTQRTGGSYPSQLLTAPLQELPLGSCWAVGEPFDEVIGEQICAGDGQLGRFDSCDGDSGGPLIIDGPKPQLYGLVSWGVGCGRKGLPGVYTRLAAYAPWIKATREDFARAALPLADLMQAIFYEPLQLVESMQDGRRRERTWTAGYQLWREAPPRLGAVHVWERKALGKTWRLQLYVEGSRSYLQLRYRDKIWEASARFSEIWQ